jgi:isovaleryl-CoA dehydrogenase
MGRSAQDIELYERFRTFGAEEIYHRVRLNGDEHRLDRQAWDRLAATGLFRLAVRPELGGCSLGLRAFAVALDGLTEGGRDLGFAVSVVAHLVSVLVLQEFGTAEQRALYLPRLLSGEWLGAVANAEAGAGTNLMAISATAGRTADGFRLTTEKQCITNVGVAGLAMVSARLEGAPARKEVNVFLVEMAGPGLEQRIRLDLAGLRTSCTGDLRAWQASLPAIALLGGLGAGLQVFRSMFCLERLFTGVLYRSALTVCLRRALEHAETCQQFGRPIGRNQYIQERVVRMRIGEQLLGSLLDDLLRAVERGEDVYDLLSVVKVYGIEAAIEASESLMRLLGGRGMCKQELAEKCHRDLLALSALGGTVELHKMVVYKELARQIVPPPTRPANLTITVHDTAELDASFEKALVDLTARIFPDVAILQGKYYYDTRPDMVVAAWKVGELAGFRVAVRRVVNLAPGTLRVAGIGIGIDPRFQRQGIGRELTRRTLEILRELNDDLALAILLRPDAEPLLRSFGFRRLGARITYNRRDTGELITEDLPAYALDLAQGTLVDDLEARGSLHLGVGTW